MKMKFAPILLTGAVTCSAFTLIGCYPYNTTDTYETETTLAAAPSAECAACGTITSIDSTGGPYERSAYQVTISLDHGGEETITQSTQPPFRVGDRVQILNQPAD